MTGQNSGKIMITTDRTSKKLSLAAFLWLCLGFIVIPTAVAISTQIWVLTSIPVGFLFGFFLQKGDLCGASAFSEVLLHKDGRKILGMWICIVLSMIGFAVLDLLGWARLAPKPFLIWNYIIGGILFGIGMVLAGGCVSGCLFKSVTGNLNSIAGVLGIPLGVGMVEYGFLRPVFDHLKEYKISASGGQALTLSSVTGLPFWVLALLLSIITVPLVLSFRRQTDHPGVMSAREPFWLRKFLTSPWKPWQAGIAIGLLAVPAYMSSVYSGRNYPLGVTHGVLQAELLLIDNRFDFVWRTKPASTDALIAPASEKPADSLTSPLNLSNILEIAYANNHDLAAAAYAVNAAKARQTIMSGERLPTLGLAGSFNHHLDEQRLLPIREPGGPSILSRDIFSSDVIFSMPIFTGGKLINQIKAAELLHLASEHRLNRTKEELAFNVTRVFYSILAQQRLIESLEFAEQTLKEHLEQVEALLSAQKVAKVDKLRVEVRLANIEQQLLRSKNILDIQSRILANLLGVEGRIDPEQLQGDLILGPEWPVPTLDKALITAWSERCDYLAAQSALKAQSYNVSAAKAGHYPNLALQGSYGERWAVGKTIGDGDETDDIGHIGFTVDLPIFEGGRVNAQIEEQQALYLSSREEFQKLRLQIKLEVETALLNAGTAKERIEAVETAVDQAKEGLRIEREKYNQGKGTVIDVLEAQTALLEAQTNYYQALAEFHIALAQLKLATGTIL